MTVLSISTQNGLKQALDQHSFRIPELEEKCRALLPDPQAYGRDSAVHFTGSSVVVDKERKHILLTLHKKLGKWLQLGGHCDGIFDPFFVAWKEAYEESGLGMIIPVSNQLFDVDLVSVPHHKQVPAHCHMDLRYLFEADINEKLSISDESVDLRWVPVIDIESYNNEASILAIGEKLRNLVC